MKKKPDKCQVSPESPVGSPPPADIFAQPYDPFDDYNSPEFHKMYSEGEDAIHRYTGKIWAAIEASPLGTTLIGHFTKIKEALEKEFSGEPLPGNGRSMTPRQNQIAYTELFVDQLFGRICGLNLDTIPQLGKPRPVNTNPAYDDDTVWEAFLLGGKIMRLSEEDPILLLHQVLELIRRPKPPPKNQSRVDKKRKQWAVERMKKLVPKNGQVKAADLVLEQLKKRDKELVLSPKTVKRWYNTYLHDLNSGVRKDTGA